ncbi:MAG: hypothetical protein R6W31_01280 [Bacteroidales bacterium]
MEKDQEKRTEELAREKLEGKSYSEIRDELKESGLSPGEINILIREVDEKVLAVAVSEGRPDKAQQWYRAGLVLAVAGLLISIAFNVGIILQNLPPLAVYAPFATGILMMFYGRVLQRRETGKEKKGPGPIRKKRPYK